MDLKEAKLKYLESESETDYRIFCETLQKSDIWFPMIWELTEEEKKKFENAEIGGDIHIETPRNPAYFQGPDDTILIYIFSERAEIPKKLWDEYSFQWCSSAWARAASKAIKTIRYNEVVIVLDVDTEPLWFGDEVFDEQKQEE